MTDELTPPEVVYCGFSRISPVRRRQQYQRALSIAESQEILLTVSLLHANRYTFTTSIHKQADIQTLARTIEALLSERRTVVACLIDLGSDIVLRWSDTIDDVLDSDSVVGVIPLSNATLVRTMQSQQVPADADVNVPGQGSLVKASTTPLPQLEFIQMDSLKSRANSFHGSISSLNDNFYIDTALVRKRSDMQHHRPTLKALRIVRPINAKNSTEKIPTVEPYATSYLPPLPMSPIPRAKETPLASLCSNSLLLLAFCRYCARKKTLCELLYWLDTSSDSASEDFTYRTYLAPDSPLKLNLPREVSTTIEARELLRDGILTWSEQGFEMSEEGMRARAIQAERPSFFRTASIMLNGPVHPKRASFVKLLSRALDPEDTSILSLKERKSLDTKQAILDQVCAQYFPGKQVDKSKYFEFKEHNLTKPERVRLSNRRQIYGGLFDKESSPSAYTHTSFRRHSQASTLSNSRLENNFGQSKEGPKIGEIMPMEDADLYGWSDVAADSTTSAKTNPRPGRNGGSMQGSARMSSERIRPSSDMSFVTLDNRHPHHSASASASSSTKSDDTQFTPVLNLSESERADLVRRQTKLRTLLGATPRDMLDRQAGNMTSELASSRPSMMPLSPTPSMMSRHTTASDSSRLSYSRAETEEEAERRTQVRRAAKLYAMFGEHANSPTSVPSYRQSSRARKGVSDYTERPASAASQYSPEIVRSPSRGSVTARSMYEQSFSRQSTFDTPKSKHQPSTRDSDRRSFRSLMFKSPKDSKLPSDVLSTFPAPPSTGSPSSPSFRHSIRGMNGFGPGSLHGDTDSIMEELESEDEEDLEGDAIVQDVRTNMKLRQLLGNDAPTSTIG